MQLPATGAPRSEVGSPGAETTAPGSEQPTTEGGAGTGAPPPSSSQPPATGGMEPADATQGPPASDSPVPPSGTPITSPDPTTASASTAGPLTVESYTSGYADSPAYLDATIWYPSNGQPPYAGVAVVPGFVSPQSSIAPWGAFLASHGFVTITIGTNTGADSPEIRAEALLAALDTLRSEHVRSGSPIEGQVDESRFALMGWSMGGGGTLIASSTHPELKAAISLAAWRPGGNFSSSTVPTLLFAATTDPLAGGQSQGFYASIPASTPKLLIEVVSGDHWLFNDPANLSGEVGRYGLSWLKVFVEGDERYRQFIEARPTVPLGSYELSL